MLTAACANSSNNAIPSDWKNVSYGGVAISVPKNWPEISLTDSVCPRPLVEVGEVTTTTFNPFRRRGRVVCRYETGDPTGPIVTLSNIQTPSPYVWMSTNLYPIVGTPKQRRIHGIAVTIYSCVGCSLGLPDVVTGPGAAVIFPGRDVLLSISWSGRNVQAEIAMTDEIIDTIRAA